ncbi:MAG: DUF2846 domain-containing protein [Desulfarculus sp.]|nr:DUF2846 domain-containing protein [Pseudomonadota bacterium]MBV1716935.1 DUF2846 domain-containing protein [Desulfarculus sp.]MBU4574616.1 DUF2846 domain-containing protein [Pseudomonadota bacterium]MBU4596662.1 DUF2846 domain-containing protein [Pseudomonadota bacterium]MBV1737756.1 DUF2846 domain-containing protein [Desulfarculus sp.]
MFILLAGCATRATQYAPLPPDLRAAPEPGKARICVIRGWLMWAMEVGCRLQDDGILIGELPNGSYVCWERPPGVARLSLHTWDPLFAAQGNLQVESDMLYYLYMDYFHQQFKSISQQEGQKYLAEYSRPRVAHRSASSPAMSAQPPSAGASVQAIVTKGGGPSPPANKSAGY